MGKLVRGVWTSNTDDSAGGEFQRQDSLLRNWVTADGSAGSTGEGGFAAEIGRYHLYVSRACPWAHRAMVMRALKGLESMIDYSVVHWYMGDDGWTFADGPGVTGDRIGGSDFLRDVYIASDAHYTGKVTVPVLWDRKTSRIVSNESADILRMFNRAFDALGARTVDYYPDRLAHEIDTINAGVYEHVNNGVYKAGFATSQVAYERSANALFEKLDGLEAVLGSRRYLCGDVQTEADWRLFTTLLRFDLVYHGHFKCNRRRLVDYPNLWSLTCELYGEPGIADTVDLMHIAHHYYESHRHINPSGIVPIGPVLDFAAASDRKPAAAGNVAR
ncbi:MAG: glutathione S-transferase family protein [Dokdonella sp.]